MGKFKLSRREFATVPFLLTAGEGLAQADQSARIQPQRSRAGQSTPGSAESVAGSPLLHQHGPDPRDPFAEALGQKIRKLQGVDPAAYLTNFDWGDLKRTENGRRLRVFEITARDVDLEVAPGIYFPAWTYNGSVPGPTLRCRHGDRLRIVFRNQSQADHTLHFHGIHSAAADGTFPLVRPGKSYVYEFDAEPPGLHLYHCHVPPVDLHMNRGMFGVFLVDPLEPLPPAKELVMVLHGWDLNFDKRNELYAINGAANYFRDHPIGIAQDELVRLYLVSALEYEPLTSFHVHGNFFTQRTVGSPQTGPLEDTIMLCQGQRAIIEFSYPHAGLFMFHPHQSWFSERGAMGFFHIAPDKPTTPSDRAAVLKQLTDSETPFTATQRHPLLGRRAPELQLGDSSGRLFDLGELTQKGPAIVVFYFGFGCLHCVAQLRRLQEHYSKFRALNTQIIAVSGDAPELTAERLATYGGFGFPTVSDLGHQVAQRFGTYAADSLQHGAFVIDRNRIVRWAHVSDEPFMDERTLLYQSALAEGAL